MSNTFFTATRVARAPRFFTPRAPRFFTSSAPTQLPSTARRIQPIHALTAGLFTAVAYTAYSTSLPTLHLDAPVGSHPVQASKTIITPKDGPALIATGNSTIPTFPATLEIDGVEHSLLGFGVRTVSFLSIQVYVGGFYVATADLPKLSSALIKRINPSASTLLPSERESLSSLLLGPESSEDLWDAVLQDTSIRSVFRIAPVRDTDFHHLRDGFVRAIQARTRAGNRPEWVFTDDGFGEAMTEFRGIFNRGKVPKKQELLLVRGQNGVMKVLFDDGKTTNGRFEVGSVKDERVSRMLWLNYLGGKNVASEAARKSITEGLLDLASRPVGSV